MPRPAPILLAAAAALGVAAAADAGPIYGFTRITTNGSEDVAGQLTVEVGSAGQSRVDFIVRNSGPLASSICDFYFDVDGTLLGIAQIFNGPGVDLSVGASPNNLPGGNAIGFDAATGFSADSNPPVLVNGVNPGEMLTIRFDLVSGRTFADTINAIELGLAQGGVAGSLRMGLHVQGLVDGRSDSFVNGSTIPLPSAAGLGGAALVGLVGRRRRRS